MKKVNSLLTGLLALLTVIMMASCSVNQDPVRVSLDIDASNLTLSIGESASRAASSEGADSHFTYSTSNPSVATVDEDGMVTAWSMGEATITVHMDENRKDWYAASDRTYQVSVKTPSSEQLRRIDRDTPLTLVALEDGKITINFCGGITLSEDIIYTINDGAEQTISKTTKGSYDIALKKNDFVQLFSYNEALSSGIAAGARGTTRAVADGAKYINIKPTMKTEIYGNAMSLLTGYFFDDDCEIEGKYAFYGLFAGAENLVNNLVRHIELPAYDITDGCYQAMFYGCKGIKRAPDLPADETMNNCYKEMFAGCSKLSYVKCLADDISAEGCTKDWLTDAGSEVTDAKTVVSTFQLPANSNDGVPAGWTNDVVFPVKSVTLDNTSLQMVAGSPETGTATQTATVKPEQASDKTVFWLTSNKKVATVDDNGKVTAVGSGEAKITATAGGKTATCTVKVTVLVTGITLDKTELEMAVGGDPVTLVAKLTPDGVTDKTVTWSSSNEKVATVDANGKVTAIGDGEATITAKAGDKEASCDVFVRNVVPISGITLDKTELSMKVGDSPVTLTAKVTPEGASDKTITWSSDNEKVATVDANGMVTAVGNGDAKITAKAGDKTATCTVKVTTVVNGITLDKTNLTMEVIDAPVKLTATVTPDGAIDKTVTWSSDKTDVVTVDADGNVTVVGRGEATITAKAGDYSATCTVKVTNTVTLSKLDGSARFTAKNGDILTGTLGGNCMIRIDDGATVTLDGVTINGVNADMYAWAGITCIGNATIILKDGTTNTVKGFKQDYPGIYVPKDNTLTIKGETLGTGSLTASSNFRAAGIGGGAKTACGNIEIQGGKITAIGGVYSPGIGSADHASCGTISISGGTVTASGGEAAAGIGSGITGTCGAISITGGTVTATGGNFGPGIGGGSFAPTCGAISISGGTVRATGGEGAAGIGSGKNGSCTTITITTNVISVTATKGTGAPNSIGAGRSNEYGTSSCGTVTIGSSTGAITESPYTYTPAH